MLDHSGFFATIQILSAAIGIFGGTLGIFAFLYIQRNKVFIKFLVNHFTIAMNKRKKNERNNKGK